jgi:hypothetical protein
MKGKGEVIGTKHGEMGKEGVALGNSVIGEDSNFTDRSIL